MTVGAHPALQPDPVYGTVGVRYRNGECHGLAQAIHAITGWPIETWMDADGDTGHCYVRVPDGRLLDIDGLHADGWDFLEPTVEPDDMALWGSYDSGLADYWAEQVLAAYLRVSAGG